MNVMPLRYTWLDRMYDRVLQEPLIQSQPSLLALEKAALRQPPKAIFMGIGLCSSTELSQTLPLDVLGMLLPAEQIRQITQAERLTVLVADAHALDNNLPAENVERHARRTVDLLNTLKRSLGLAHMRIVRASLMHQSRRYQEIFQEVSRKAPDGAHLYIRKQVADVAYMHRAAGGILKIGWSLSARAATSSHHRDETAFDACVGEWLQSTLPYIYCKPGRNFCDHRKKTAPYIAQDTRARICLQKGENVEEKIRWAENHATPETVRGALKHLRAIANTFSRQIEPLQGPTHQRIEQILRRIFCSC